MFTILTKFVKWLNLKWVEDEGKPTEKKHKQSLPDVTVRWNNALTVEQLLAWCKAPKANEKKLANIVRHFNDKILYHEASDRNKALGVLVAKGEKTREDLDKFVYVHDYDAEKREKLSTEERQAKALAELSDADLAKVLELRKKRLADKA